MSLDDPKRHISKLGDHDVLFVMAAQAEYGPCLQAAITPLMTGVGPVEAASVVSTALTMLAADKALPDLIVSLGSAGSQKLEQAEVYQIASVAYRDMDASPLGFPKGQTPFLDHPPVMPLPHQIPGIPSASISTGGNIVSGPDYARIEADMVDMESFAVMRAAQRFRIPMVGLRGISDGAEDLHHYDDWTQYLHVIDEKLAHSIAHFEQCIHMGSFRLKS